MARNYAALPHEYLEEMEMLSDEEFGRLVRALLLYSMTGETIAPSGNERFYAKRVMNREDRYLQEYETLISRNAENGKKGGRPKKPPVFSENPENPPVLLDNPENPPVFLETQKSQSETETKAETDTNIESMEPPAEAPAPTHAKPARHKRSQYGWVKLSDDEYSRLSNELGEDELKRCITYVDESAQSTGNKNKWRDWNLVIRKCHREGWGLQGQRAISASRSNASPKPQNTTSRDIERMQQVLARISGPANDGAE